MLEHIIDFRDWTLSRFPTNGLRGRTTVTPRRPNDLGRLVVDRLLPVLEFDRVETCLSPGVRDVCTVTSGAEFERVRAAVLRSAKLFFTFARREISSSHSIKEVWPRSDFGSSVEAEDAVELDAEREAMELLIEPTRSSQLLEAVEGGLEVQQLRLGSFLFNASGSL